MKSYTWRHAIINSELEGTTRHVLLTLSCHINDAGESAYPSTKTLARECAVSEPTICKHLRLAKCAGWLIVRKHGFGGQAWARSEYYPRIPDDFEIPDWDIQGTKVALVPSDEKLSTEALKQVKRVGKKGTKRGLVPQEKALNLTHEGTKPDVQKALKQVKSNYSENYPLTTPSSASGEEGEKAQCLKTEQPAPGFDRFWSAWPSHSGRKMGTQQAANAVWTALDLESDAELIVMHVKAMALTKKWLNGFDPSPVRYLSEQWWHQGTPEQSPAVVDETDIGNWWETDSGIEAKARALGVARLKNEPTPQFLVRVAKEAGKGPHIEPVLRAAQRVSAEWHQRVVQHFGDALIPVDYFA